VPPRCTAPSPSRCFAPASRAAGEADGAGATECAALQAAARATAALRVNHNFVFHPAQLAAQRLPPATRSAPSPRRVPLQHAAAQLAPASSATGCSIPVQSALEQVVHPLSQIDDLVGSAEEIAVVVPPRCISARARTSFARGSFAALPARHGAAPCLARSILSELGGNDHRR